MFKQEGKKFFPFDSVKRSSGVAVETFQKLEGNERWAFRKGCVHSPMGFNESSKLAVLTGMEMKGVCEEVCSVGGETEGRWGGLTRNHKLCVCVCINTHVHLHQCRVSYICECNNLSLL